MKYIYACLLLLCCSLSLRAQSLYFPPSSGNTWDTLSPNSLGWCGDKLDTLINFVGNTNARAFILLKDGKIVVEKYYGSFTRDSLWYWASAGKSLTAFLVGLAQEQGSLQLGDSLSKYLGHGFSSCSPQSEDKIKIWHQLTMTTGFDDAYSSGTQDSHCTADSCLICIAAPGTRWAYHNAPYTLLHRVLDTALHMSVNTFKNQKLLASTGIGGGFVQSGWDEVYVSQPRAFARFGLLMLAKGSWNGTRIMHDSLYFQSMVNSSQSINPSYGYLWWLNGKSSYRLPSSQISFNGSPVAHAPADMFAALGKNDQILNVVPSMNLVMIRMGDPMYTSKEVANFSNDSIWVRLNSVFCAPAAIQSESREEFGVYPNPAANELYVKGLSANGAETIEILDMTGRKLIEVSGRQKIDISALKAGHYLLQIRNNGGRWRRMFCKE